MLAVEKSIGTKELENLIQKKLSRCELKIIEFGR